MPVGSPYWERNWGMEGSNPLHRLHRAMDHKPGSDFLKWNLEVGKNFRKQLPKVWKVTFSMDREDATPKQVAKPIIPLHLHYWDSALSHSHLLPGLPHWFPTDNPSGTSCHTHPRAISQCSQNDFSKRWVWCCQFFDKYLLNGIYPCLRTDWGWSCVAMVGRGSRREREKMGVNSAGWARKWHDKHCLWEK